MQRTTNNNDLPYFTTGRQSVSKATKGLALTDQRFEAAKSRTGLQGAAQEATLRDRIRNMSTRLVEERQEAQRQTGLYLVA